MEDASLSAAADKVEMGPMIIDQDGDLILAVGPSDCQSSFKVDASTLRRTSPVWKAMLYRPWIESQPKDDSEWIVELPEDDPAALTVLLGIIHSNFDLVPATDKITASLVWGILVLCDKYDMIQSIIPYITIWRTHIKQQAPKSEVILSLLIAWEIGDENWLRDLLKDLVHHTCVYGSTKQITYESVDNLGFHTIYLTGSALEKFGPPQLLDHIVDIRSRVLNYYLRFINTEIEIRLSGKPRRPDAAQRPCRHEVKGCDELVLGGLIRGLSMVGLPAFNLRKKATEVNMNIAKFEEACHGVFHQLKIYPDTLLGRTVQLHDTCAIGPSFEFSPTMKNEARTKIREEINKNLLT
ncbi:hypothetical protein B0T21DRAFT_32488 [Apiosordaria backusii]|uniref:BTB domain-containing protein n=1 Tax=Apiosordaria backusii TaxID=314023 RepID=A0AA40B269_9PEZI|nr:hypothetical protein B0T21DRAFT_32488 [Apiosordaria backusii]